MEDYKDGSVIYAADDKITQIAQIISGRVDVMLSGEPLSHLKDDVIGIMGMTDTKYSIYSYDHIVVKDVILDCYDISDSNDLVRLLKNNKSLSRALQATISKNMCRIINKYYSTMNLCNGLHKYLITLNKDYNKLCELTSLKAKSLLFIDDITKFVSIDEIEDWEKSYHFALNDLVLERSEIFDDANLVYGYYRNAIVDIARINNSIIEMEEYLRQQNAHLLSESKIDYYEIFCNYYIRSKKNDSLSDEAIQKFDNLGRTIGVSKYISHSLWESRQESFLEELSRLERVQESKDSCNYDNAESELSNSFNIIAEYTDCSEELATAFRDNINKYKSLEDKNSGSDEAESIRKELTKEFYQLYTEAFQISIGDENIPRVVKMFLMFGYMDVELSGYDTAYYLYTIVDNYGDIADPNIFTFYEWLKAIYNGNREPSRTETNMDYAAYLRGLRSKGKIDENMEAHMRDDGISKVMFELQHLFPSTNKITFGRFQSYCPILIEENMARSVESCIVSPNKVREAVDKITSIDFSAYYRDYMFEDNVLGIRDFIQLEVLPDIILMPNVGIRGILWQEIEGAHRDTPARIFMSVMFQDDIYKMICYVTGVFRWEMCKRMQGGRWNDVTYHSLTSEYYDYLQFYSKNRDLSSEAKQKVKSALSKVRNNYREMFISEYLSWVMHESEGSSRLNKVARRIMLNFCPFNKTIRDSLSKNAMYADAINQYNNRLIKRLTTINNQIQKQTMAKKKVPKVYSDQIEMLSR